MKSNINNLDGLALLSTIEEMNAMLKDMQKYSSGSFLPLSNKLKDYFKTMNSYEEIDQSRVVRKKACISKIVTELQFHDIIRQKLEHIEEINMELLSEIKQLLRWDNLVESKYLNILPNLIRLSIAQIDVINQEFIHAVGMLKTNMVELDSILGKDLVSDQHPFLSPAEFLKTSNALISKLHAISIRMPVAEIADEIREKYYYLESVYTMESERIIFYQVFNLPESLVRREAEVSPMDVDLF